jgi:hypothetical protein
MSNILLLFPVVKDSANGGQEVVLLYLGAHHSHYTALNYVTSYISVTVENSVNLMVFEHKCPSHKFLSIIKDSEIKQEILLLGFI